MSALDCLQGRTAWPTKSACSTAISSAAIEADPHRARHSVVACGLLGFLPVLGFWMLPLGLLVLSVDFPIVRRWRRQLTVWWHRRKVEAVPVASAGSASKQETR